MAILIVFVIRESYSDRHAEQTLEVMRMTSSVHLFCCCCCCCCCCCGGGGGGGGFD